MLMCTAVPLVAAVSMQILSSSVQRKS